MSVLLFVPDIPEFLPLVHAAQKVDGCVVHQPTNGYWKVAGKRGLHFSRKSMGLGPALWNSALSGGFRGRIVEYGHDIMRIESEPE